MNSSFDQKTGKEIEYISLPSTSAEEIHVKTKEGFSIYFSLKRGPEGQLNDLAMILDGEIDSGNVEYIDLRIENWVYYK